VITEVEETNALLDEILAGINNMLGSRYVKNIREKV
jgi:hypothetical protein